MRDRIMSAPSSSGRGRCAAHGLALGPDNSCVLCRRESAQPASGEEPWTEPPASRVSAGNLSFALFGLSLAGAALFFAFREPSSPHRERDEVIARAPAPPPPVDELERARPRNSPPSSDHLETKPAEFSSPRRPLSVDAPRPTARGNLDRPATLDDPPSAPSSLGQEELRRYLRQVEVELYTTSWCKYCVRAREFLQSNGIAFREYDVETDPAAADRKRSLVPDSGVPVVRIDGRVMSGFSAANYGEAIRSSLERRSGVPVQLTLR